MNRFQVLTLVLMPALGGAPLSAEEWEIGVAGAAAGGEHVTASAEGFSAEGGFTYQGAVIKSKYAVSFDADKRLSGFEETLDLAGTALRAVGTDSGNSIAVRLEQGGRILGERSFPRGADLVLLDNNIASQYRALSTLLHPVEGGRVAFRLLVPQALSVLPAEATLQKQVYPWTNRDGKGEAIRWEITLSPPQPMPLSVYQDAASGAILGVDIPIAKVTYRLAGFLFTAEAVPTAVRPAYLDPSRVEEREVTVKTGDFSMGATMTYPKGAADPVPGVLLIAGSGPNDRDETVGGSKPFRDLATGLASRGFAVLRFDKRTAAYRDRLQLLDVPRMTVYEEFVADAVAALRLLAADPRVDGSRLAMVGHSLGGWGLPEIWSELGADASRVRHMVFLAPAGKDWGAMMLRQMRFQLSLAPDSGELKESLAAAEETLGRYKATGKFPGPLLGASALYWEDLFRRDPVGAVVKVPADMLFVRGSKDIQVSEVEMDSWRQALSGRKDAEFVTLEDCNHLFAEIAGPSTGAEYYREGYVSPRLIDLVAGRIGK